MQAYRGDTNAAESAKDIGSYARPALVEQPQNRVNPTREVVHKQVTKLPALVGTMAAPSFTPPNKVQIRNAAACAMGTVEAEFAKFTTPAVVAARAIRVIIFPKFEFFM